MKWTKIADTDLAIEAWKILDASQCDYHNGWHVENMYTYLDKTNEPYDEALDWAVLFHDIVYDNLPEKELRSAKMFKDMAEIFSGCTPDIWERERICQLILQTSDHIHNPNRVGSSAIIRADLHALTNPIDVFYNYRSIMEESMCLYEIDEQTFAVNNIRFMEGLHGRICGNEMVDIDHKEFYGEVRRGIKSTIALSRIIMGEL
jgi:predicted metal-dependent HD superfamily phosphohydrolase